jgi:hypothetical protein
MPRRRCRLLAGLTLLLVLAAGCGPKYVNRNDQRPEPAVVPAPTTAETFPRLFLDQVATPTVLYPGEVLTIELRFVNDSSSPQFLPAPGDLFGFRIQDDAGRRVAPPPPPWDPRLECSYPMAGAVFEPGESGTVVFFWLYDDRFVPPGEYFLFSGIGTYGYRASADWVRIVLKGPGRR